MKKVIAIFLIFIFITSCSFYKLTNNYVNRKMKHNGLCLKEVNIVKFTIWYWDTGGEKPVILLLHGFGPSAGFQWFRQVRELSHKYRLIIPDLLFFGGSKSTEPDFSIEEQVEAMQAMLNHLKVNTFYMCGVSYGGLVAAELALKRKDQVKKLVLFDTPVKYFKEENLLPLYKKYRVKNSQDLLVPDDHHTLKALLALAYYRTPFIPSFMLEDLRQNMFVDQAQERRNLLISMENNRRELESRIYDFNFPVLLIWGEEDQLIPVIVGQQLKAHIGDNAGLEIMKNSAHMPNLEHPRRFNDLILDFFGK